MLAMLVSDDGTLIQGETWGAWSHTDWSRRKTWENVLGRLREQAAKTGATDVIICEGDVTADVDGPMDYRDSGTWDVFYHEQNGEILVDKRGALI